MTTEKEIEVLEFEVNEAVKFLRNIGNEARAQSLEAITAIIVQKVKDLELAPGPASVLNKTSGQGHGHAFGLKSLPSKRQPFAVPIGVSAGLRDIDENI